MFLVLLMLCSVTCTHVCDSKGLILKSVLCNSWHVCMDLEYICEPVNDKSHFCVAHMMYGRTWTHICEPG